MRVLRCKPVHLFGLLLAGLTMISLKPAPQVIVFFGDSLTAGYGLSKTEAFPAKIEKILTAQGKNIRVVNAGLSGETSAGGTNRIGWILRQPMDVFVLELGANDALRGLPIKKTQDNLQAIIDSVKTRKPQVKIVVAGMKAPPNMGKEYTSSFSAIYPLVAKKNHVTLIPFLLEGVAGNTTLNQADGIHPNVKGHQLIAEQVAKTIKPLLP